MNQSTVNYLICPECLSGDLVLEKYNFLSDEILEGRLVCQACKLWFRIENGIVDLLPLNLRKHKIYILFAEKYSLQYNSKQAVDAIKGKTSQIDFFKENVSDYEKDVVNSKYYQALDQLAFIEWMKNNLRPGQLVLNLGCGTGRQDMPLAMYKIKTIGVDISEDMLRLEKQKINKFQLNGYIDLIIGDAENPPLRNGCFDACIFYGTLHHFPNKEFAIFNASNKLRQKGLYYSLDPHNSPVRFIFDLLMKIWKIYDEDASDSPLFSENQLKNWLSKAQIRSTTKLSTYLPPHFFHLLGQRAGINLLSISDKILRDAPVLRKLAGVIIAEGIKETDEYYFFKN